MQIYNTLSRKIEEFVPLNPPHVGMYACGPTVYDYTHIGHVRKYINDDILVRVLRANGYEVDHVVNITDVGHLSSDADSGEDKLEEGAKKLKKSVLEVAQFFEKDFWNSLKLVNIIKPNVICRATEHIDDQLALIEVLVSKGFTYKTKQAIYFDVSKFPDYTKLSGQKLEDKLTGARSDVVVDKEKKNPADFALWFFMVGRFTDHALKWSSPWGEGFPGWHIECSAMSMKYLGLSFDIHTGGIDHIPVHHTNEIAQSESATGKIFVKYWIHYAFLMVEGKKMSKSFGNFFRIGDLVSKNFSPLAFRYLTFQTHYRSEMNFTWEALASAQITLNKLYEIAGEIKDVAEHPDVDYERDFLDALNLDLNMPKALSVMWEMLKSNNLSSPVKAATLYKMDEILGLELKEKASLVFDVPVSISELVNEREKLRKERKFVRADHIRAKIEKMGYEVKDEEKGVVVKKKI